MKTFLARAIALTTLATAPASAALVYSTDFSAVGAEWSTTAGFNAGLPGIYGDFDGGVATLTLPLSITGASLLTFDLLPFRSIDGVNCCTDTFTAKYNGATLFSGVFAAGGGGSDSFSVPSGGSITGITGGRRISLAFTAAAGPSLFEFTYGALQGYADEGWGLDNVSVDSSRATTPPIPEPATWAMMIGGFALAGSALRRRRTTAVRFA